MCGSTNAADAGSYDAAQGVARRDWLVVVVTVVGAEEYK